MIYHQNSTKSSEILPKNLKVDVCLFGAGITGLLCAKRLTDLGLRVALVEKNETLANSPSTRNEGWLHRGTYHATSIRDRSSAVQVAKRCIYGHEQIKKYAPEAIEDSDLAAYALIKNSDIISEITSRWNEAEVKYRSVDLAQIAKSSPEVNLDDVSVGFQVYDLAINTRILYSKLTTDIIRSGVPIIKGVIATFKNTQQAVINTIEGETKNIKASIFLYTAGYGTKEIFQQQFGIDINMRFWKSHLLILPRIATNAIYCLDPKEAVVVNHGNVAIAGMNEDAFLCEEPNFEIVPEKVEELYKALENLFHLPKTLPYQATACVKVDMAGSNNSDRSLNISIHEPSANHLCVLPGKMTEAPYLADKLTQLIYSRLTDNRIALRPCDKWETDEKLLSLANSISK
jgi:glycerol-3-phosphate dehydrogenase